MEALEKRARELVQTINAVKAQMFSLDRTLSILVAQHEEVTKHLRREKQNEDSVRELQRKDS